MIISIINIKFSSSNFAKIISLFGLTQFIVVIFAGGDWMELGRFLSSSLFFLVFGLIYGLSNFKYTLYFVQLNLLIYSFFHISNVAKLIRPFYYQMTNIDYFPILNNKANKEMIFKKYNNKYFYNKFSKCDAILELNNYIHIRDCILLDFILQDIEDKKYKFEKGDIIMSKQAGLINYNLKNRYPFLRIIDPLGLGSNERIKIKI